MNKSIRALLALIFLTQLAFSDLQISANSIVIDRKNYKIKLNGNAKIKNKADILTAKTIHIDMNKNKEVNSFNAFGGVELYYFGKTKSFYFKAKQVKSKNNIYTLIGDVYYKDIDTNEVINAEKIVVNQKTETVSIDGTSKKQININLKIK